MFIVLKKTMARPSVKHAQLPARGGTILIYLEKLTLKNSNANQKRFFDAKSDF
jgi:hypothetical protein